MPKRTSDKDGNFTDVEAIGKDGSHTVNTLLKQDGALSVEVSYLDGHRVRYEPDTDESDG